MKRTIYVILIVFILACEGMYSYPRWYGRLFCPPTEVEFSPTDSAAAMQLCDTFANEGLAEVAYLTKLRCFSRWQTDSVIVLPGVDWENCTIVYYPNEPCLECNGRTW